MSQLYIGLMSGTSMDGVDVALCEIGKRGCKTVSSLTHPFDPALKNEILGMAEKRTTLEQVGRIDQRLGELFAEAARALMVRESLEPGAIAAIGSHGQTVWHAPQGDHAFSMQLGDPNVISVRTGCRVVADFRRRDMALGGQGAPFAPVFHRFLFGALDGRTVVLNLGGIANITILENPLRGFDTGPGNVLMDLWTSRQRSTPYDAEGAWARTGSVNDALLEMFLEDPYFAEPAPKSTGRERFNAQWLDSKLLHFLLLNAADVQATLLELTVRTTVEQIAKVNPTRLLVGGGGARNTFLMERLAEALPGVEVTSTDTYGASSDSLESMMIAWLASRRLHEEPVDLMHVTGASANGVLGGIYG